MKIFCKDCNFRFDISASLDISSLTCPKCKSNHLALYSSYNNLVQKLLKNKYYVLNGHCGTSYCSYNLNKVYKNTKGLTITKFIKMLEDIQAILKDSPLEEQFLSCISFDYVGPDSSFYISLADEKSLCLIRFRYPAELIIDNSRPSFSYGNLYISLKDYSKIYDSNFEGIDKCNHMLEHNCLPSYVNHVDFLSNRLDSTQKAYKSFKDFVNKYLKKGGE